MGDVPQSAGAPAGLDQPEIKPPPERKHTFHWPVNLKNGREVGAWAYGVACGVSMPGEDPPILHVEISKEHLEGAAAAIVAAGGSVRRVGEYEDRFPIGEGNEMIQVGLS